MSNMDLASSTNKLTYLFRIGYIDGTRGITIGGAEVVVSANPLYLRGPKSPSTAVLLMIHGRWGPFTPFH